MRSDESPNIRKYRCQNCFLCCYNCNSEIYSGAHRNLTLVTLMNSLIYHTITQLQWRTDLFISQLHNFQFIWINSYNKINNNHCIILNIRSVYLFHRYISSTCPLSLCLFSYCRNYGTLLWHWHSHNGRQKGILTQSYYVELMRLIYGSLLKEKF